MNINFKISLLKSLKVKGVTMAREQRKFSESVLNLTNRSKLTLSGVEKVIAISETKVFLIVGGSQLKISGNNLQVEKLDVENGLLRLDGFVDEIKFDQKKVPFLKRFFK
jgi:sporulation protein YabP